MQSPVKINISEGLLIAMLASINFTHIMDFVIMAPLSATLKIAMSITTKEFGYLVSIYTFAAAAGAIIAFFRIDRYDRRTAIIFVYTGFIIANILCALAPQYKFFMMARLFAGLFGGVLNVLIMSVIGDVIPMERRGKATGMVMAAFSAASVIGIPSGLILAGIFDYHAPFWLLSILSAFVGIILILKFPSIKSHMEVTGSRTPPMEILKEYIQDSNIRRALLFIFLLMIAGFSVVPFISDYLVNNVGLDLDELKYVYLCGGLATIASSIFVGRLADKLGKVKTFVIAALISIIPIAVVTVLPVMPLMYVLMFNVIFFMCFGARFVPAMTLMTSCVQPHRRGSFLSVSSAIQQLGSGFAVLIASTIIVNGAKGELYYFGWVGVVACAATLLSIFVSLRIKEVS
jgi:predicted MFS family arabinose efflux permease